ncbi:MAG TPA: hypothetical protein VI461_13860, partial [Chitinophagaceae bacterium]|nr:hypothetical protein [Chitinophagaceae bacterium]
MKPLLCFFALSVIFSDCFATDFYSQGSVCPNTLSNWNVNPQGGGAAPTSFTDPGDRFIIQTGDTMITAATWTIGAAGSVLQIQNGGTLKADHSIILAGTFQIDDGGTYIHNNTGSVDEAADNSIFSGSELFAADSHFEIRKWPGKNVGLPNAEPGISWGDLIVNLDIDLAPDMLQWNWDIEDGASLTVKGNLDIRSTYITYSNQTELCFTSTGIQTIHVEGNFLLSGNKTKVSLKGTYSDGYVTMQVDSNILLTDMVQLNLGLKTTSPNPHGLYELRFKRDFSVLNFAILVYDSNNPVYLVANGSSPQNFICGCNFNRNFRVAPGAIVNLVSSLNTTTQDANLVISGTFNQNGNNITTYSKIECAGGFFNSTGNLRIADSCISCSNLNGTYNSSGNTWCTESGEIGKINFNNAVVTLDNNFYSPMLSAGSPLTNSLGEIYFIGSTATSLSVGANAADYVLQENSILSFDGSSYVAGNGARYIGKGGHLKISSSDGITGPGNTINGNVRTGLSKDYDFSG